MFKLCMNYKLGLLLWEALNWLAALLRTHVSAINEIVLLHDVHYGIS